MTVYFAVNVVLVKIWVNCYIQGHSHWTYIAHQKHQTLACLVCTFTLFISVRIENCQYTVFQFKIYMILLIYLECCNWYQWYFWKYNQISPFFLLISPTFKVKNTRKSTDIIRKKHCFNWEKRLISFANN